MTAPARHRVTCIRFPYSVKYLSVLGLLRVD